MARRTDAGHKEAAITPTSADRPKLFLWAAGAVAAFLVIANLISLI